MPEKFNFVPPKLKYYVERLRPPLSDKLSEIVDDAIINEMIKCLLHMRPRHRPRVQRRSMDPDRAEKIVYEALAITWKWLAEDQYHDVFRGRYDEARKQAGCASKLIFRLSNALDLAASQNLALRKKLEQAASMVNFDREMLEGWLLEIVELTGTEFETLPEAFNSIEVIEATELGKDEHPLWLKLPAGCTSRDILLRWDAMHPIVRSNVERRLRNEPASSIRTALVRIPVFINQELRDLAASRLPHVRVLQRRLNFLLGRSGLGIGAMEETYKDSPSQEFVLLAQKAFGVEAIARVSRHAVKDEHRRQRANSNKARKAQTEA